VYYIRVANSRSFCLRCCILTYRYLIFILNFRIDALCCVSLEAGELFGILILANFGIILFGRNFLLKYIFELQLFSFLSWF